MPTDISCQHNGITFKVMHSFHVKKNIFTAMTLILISSHQFLTIILSIEKKNTHTLTIFVAYVTGSNEQKI